MHGNWTSIRANSFPCPDSPRVWRRCGAVATSPYRSGGDEALREDYSGPFDPGLGLSGFSRQLLADLGREYLLNGHLQDRVGLPLVAKHCGGNAYVRFSIEEWMGASPIYS